MGDPRLQNCGSSFLRQASLEGFLLCTYSTIDHLDGLIMQFPPWFRSEGEQKKLAKVDLLYTIASELDYVVLQPGHRCPDNGRESHGVCASFAFRGFLLMIVVARTRNSAADETSTMAHTIAIERPVSNCCAQFGEGQPLCRPKQIGSNCLLKTSFTKSWMNQFMPCHKANQHNSQLSYRQNRRQVRISEKRIGDSIFKSAFTLSFFSTLTPRA